MRTLWLVLGLAGCANGVAPEPCPTVIVYLSFDSTATMQTDSVVYPECHK